MYKSIKSGLSDFVSKKSMSCSPNLVIPDTFHPHYYCQTFTISIPFNLSFKDTIQLPVTLSVCLKILVKQVCHQCISYIFICHDFCHLLSLFFLNQLLWFPSTLFFKHSNLLHVIPMSISLFGHPVQIHGITVGSCGSEVRVGYSLIRKLVNKYSILSRFTSESISSTTIVVNGWILANCKTHFKR